MLHLYQCLCKLAWTPWTISFWVHNPEHTPKSSKLKHKQWFFNFICPLVKIVYIFLDIHLPPYSCWGLPEALQSYVRTHSELFLSISDPNHVWFTSIFHTVLSHSWVFFLQQLHLGKLCFSFCVDFFWLILSIASWIWEKNSWSTVSQSLFALSYVIL